MHSPRSRGSAADAPLLSSTTSPRPAAATAWAPSFLPAGAAADYISIIGTRRGNELQPAVVSLCARHANEQPVD
jgi:hypothetical protein